MLRSMVASHRKTQVGLRARVVACSCRARRSSMHPIARWPFKRCAAPPAANERRLLALLGWLALACSPGSAAAPLQLPESAALAAAREPPAAELQAAPDPQLQRLWREVARVR